MNNFVAVNLKDWTVRVYMYVLSKYMCMLYECWVCQCEAWMCECWLLISNINKIITISSIQMPSYNEHSTIFFPCFDTHKCFWVVSSRIVRIALRSISLFFILLNNHLLSLSYVKKNSRVNWVKQHHFSRAS